jgi:hypothetical protein
MKNFHRLATGINTGPLMASLARNPGWWHEDTYLRTFPQGPFGETDSIILRFPPRPVPKTEEEKEEYLRTVDQHECVDQPIYGLLPEARQLVMNLFSYVGGTRLGRVMINRIQPGGRVYKHADTTYACRARPASSSLLVMNRSTWPRAKPGGSTTARAALKTTARSTKSSTTVLWSASTWS